MGAGKGISRRVQAVNNANIISGERVKPKFNIGDFVSSDTHGKHRSRSLIHRIVYNEEDGTYHYYVCGKQFTECYDENEITLVKSAASQEAKNYREYFYKPVTFQYRPNKWEDIIEWDNTDMDFDISQLDGQQAHIISALSHKACKKTGNIYKWLNKIEGPVFFKLHFNKYDESTNQKIQKFYFSVEDFKLALPALPTLSAEALDDMPSF